MPDPSLSGLLAQSGDVVAGWIAAHRYGQLTAFLRVLSLAHGTAPVVAAAWVLAVWLIYRGDWRWLAGLVFALPVGMLVHAAVKYFVQDGADALADPLVAATRYNYPSGHVARAALLYGFACVLVFAHRPSWAVRALAVTGAVAMLVLVAFSRMLLRGHSPADVLAGAVLGLAWLALSLVLLRALHDPPLARWFERDKG